MLHKAGFISIIGKPNVGKSTLLNALSGEALSVVTHKAQTTRHRIRNIVSGENFQLIFSDTPGMMEPAYLLQEKMMNFVKAALEDADLLLVMLEVGDKNKDEKFVEAVRASGKKIILLLNKVDLSDQKMVEEAVEYWQKILQPIRLFPVSALHKFGMEELMKALILEIPESPAYFPKDQITDLSERFFVAEIIREKILKYYHAEIPYSVQVVTESFKEEENIIKINVVIYTEKESQKNILIGPKGAAIKQVGVQARKSIELFVKKKIYLELLVKVKENWRNRENELKGFGYTES